MSRSASLLTYLSAPANIVFVLVLAAVVAAHLYSFFATLLLSPVGFDEAFNLQAPLNLVAGNGYATEDFMSGGPRVVFDPIVSTGPIVELPAALSFLLFGTTIEAARLVMLPFLLILLGSLFVLGRRVAGRWGGVVAVGVALAFDARVDFPFSMIYGSSDALGEYAAAALIALALVFFSRGRLAPAVLLGLAALAKFITFIAVPVFMIALLLVPAVRGRFVGRPVRELLAFGGLAVLPSIVWEMVKLISLGPTGYVAVFIDYAKFIFRSGSGADGGSRAFFLERLSRLFSAWYLPTAIVGLLAVILFALALYGILRFWGRGGMLAEWRRSGEGKPRSLVRVTSFASTLPAWVWAAAGTLAAFALWWTFISTSLFVRHMTPVLIVTVPIIAAFATRAVVTLIRSGGWRRIVAGVVAVGLLGVGVFQAGSTVFAATHYTDWTRGSQEATASFIRESGFDEVQGLGWWAAPAIRLLSGVPSTPVGTGSGPLVLEPITYLTERGTYDLGLSLCDDILYEKGLFVVCTIPDDTKPLEDQ